MGEKATRPIRSAQTLLTVLEALERVGPAGVTRLATEVDASKSTVHNHLSTLREQGYVVTEGSEYRLGLRFLQLGERARTYTDVYEVARPEVNALADETKLLANLDVEEQGRGVYLYRSREGSDIRLSTRAGERHDLHCTATGKAMLAYLPDERLKQVLETPGLKRRTPNTITDESALRDHLATVQERGVAFDEEEYDRGLRCVGAPIRTGSGTVVGAISISGPAAELTGNRFRSELADRVVQATNRVELNLRDY